MRRMRIVTIAGLFLLVVVAIGCDTSRPSDTLAADKARLYVKQVARVPYKIRASIQDAVDTTARRTTTLDSNWNIVEKDSQKIVVSSPSGRRRTFDRKVTTTNPNLKAVLFSSTDNKSRVVAIDDSITFADEDYTVFDIRPSKLIVILMRKRDHGRVVVRRRHAMPRKK